MSCAVVLPGILIKQGDSISMLLGLNNIEDLSGWSCRVVVATSAGASPLLTSDVETMNDNGDRFVVFISRSVTANWEIRDYLIMARIWNATTGESAEFHMELRVERGGVS